MIVIDSTTPRWIRELERFRHLKNLIFLHGNIHDTLVFANERNGGIEWIGGYTIDFFLRRFFNEKGYPIVAVMDPLSGLEPPPNGSPDQKGSAGGAHDPRTRTAVGQVQQANSAQSGNSGTSRGDARDIVATGVSHIADAMRNKDTPCCYILTLASRFITTPGYPSEREHAMLTQVLKASLQGVTAFGPNGERNNLIVIVCDKLNDFPPFLYVDNPRARAIQVDKPDRAARERFFRANETLFHRSGGQSEASADLVSQFAFLTEGLANYELQSLLTLSVNERIPLQPLDALISRYKFGITQSEWDSPELRVRLSKADTVIRERVKGQDTAVARVTDLVKRAWLGLAAGEASRTHRPRGVLFFAGPTGVGKTEMAKALAELLFGSEERMIRFDMSEYAAEHADQRLLGSPPGYIGYEEGGQLTNQVKEYPFSVLLFDEIEKAHPRIFDKFLQILDDGRLTDGKGDTVYFSESVIIFTSNLGSVTLERPGQNVANSLRSGSPQGARSTGQIPVNRGMPYSQVRDTILDAISRHFNERLGRPEILNRFGDNFVIFDFIRPPLHIAIVEHMINRLCSAMKKVHDIQLSITEGARTDIERLAEAQLDHGGRGIRNLIDRALVDPLARWLFDQGTKAPSRGIARLEVDRVRDDGEEARSRYVIEVRAINGSGS